VPIGRAADELLPCWYSDRDRPWLRDLLAEVEACAGRPLAELAARWRRATTDPRAGRRAAGVRHLVLRALRARRRSEDLGPLRRELFTAVAGGADRAAALAAIAAGHGRSAEDLAAHLFDDLPHARPVDCPDFLLDPTRLALATNLAIAKAVLLGAEAAELRLSGASRAVLQTAWLHGAHFSVRRATAATADLAWARAPDAAGPARGLAAIVPVLPWARRFELRARCRLGELAGTFVLTSHDPILPGPEPRTFDSRLERRFARDLRALSPDWELLREPVPLLLGGGRMVFPDFLLRHRGHGSAWLVEIAGLRDRGALDDKLAVLAAEPRFLLCLPAALVPAGFETHPRVLPFGRRVDAAALLGRLDRFSRLDPLDRPG
jgi:predicted nuclease of restriction endonuclease-like RecB superfamily